MHPGAPTRTAWRWACIRAPARAPAPQAPGAHWKLEIENDVQFSIFNFQFASLLFSKLKMFQFSIYSMVSTFNFEILENLQFSRSKLWSWNWKLIPQSKALKSKIEKLKIEINWKIENWKLKIEDCTDIWSNSLLKWFQFSIFNLFQFFNFQFWPKFQFFNFSILRSLNLSSVPPRPPWTNANRFGALSARHNISRTTCRLFGNIQTGVVLSSLFVREAARLVSRIKFVNQYRRSHAHKTI